MDRELQALLKAIASLPRRGPKGRRTYPTKLRAAVVDLVRRERRSGRSLETAARRVGVPLTTVSNWLVSESAEAPRASGLRPVRVLAAQEASGEPARERPVVITPGGYRVEGLSPEGVARLLQSLT